MYVYFECNWVMTVVCCDMTPSFCRCSTDGPAVCLLYLEMVATCSVKIMIQVCQTRHHIPASHILTLSWALCVTLIWKIIIWPPLFFLLLSALLVHPGEHFICLMNETSYAPSHYPASSIVSRCLYTQYNCLGLTVMPGVQTGCWAISVSWQWRQSLALNHWQNGTSWCNPRPKKILLEFLCLYARARVCVCVRARAMKASGVMPCTCSVKFNSLTAQHTWRLLCVFGLQVIVLKDVISSFSV